MTDGVGVWKADFFVRVSMLQLGIDLQGRQSKGNQVSHRLQKYLKIKFYFEKSSKMKFALESTGKTPLKTYILVIGRH